MTVITGEIIDATPQQHHLERFTATGRRTQDTPDFSALIADFLATYTSKATWNAYRADVDRFMTFLDDLDLDVKDVSAAHARLFVERLINSKTGAPLSDTSKNRVAACVSRFLDHLIVSGVKMTHGNGFKSIRRHRVSASHTTTATLTDRQLDALLDAAKAHSKRDYALIILLASTGVRVSEAINADLEHISTHYGQDGEKSRVLTITVKGGHRRRVTVPPKAYAALMDYHTAESWDKAVERPEDTTSTPLFTTWDGHRLDRVSASDIVSRAAQRARRAGVQMPDRVTAHSLRHTVATTALREGFDLTAVAKQLGHSDIKTTQRYAHVDDAIDTSIGKMMNSRF